MQKLGGAVIHMQQNLNNELENKNVLKGISYLVGNEDILRNLLNVPPKNSFDEDVINFLNDLSKKLSLPLKTINDGMDLLEKQGLRNILKYIAPFAICSVQIANKSINSICRNIFFKLAIQHTHTSFPKLLYSGTESRSSNRR